ncbi:MAG: hypothetical protein Q7T46_12905 [Polaromonas sp.]|nr:hypothetical protein [Polaromonas sp.]
MLSPFVVAVKGLEPTLNSTSTQNKQVSLFKCRHILKTRVEADKPSMPQTSHRDILFLFFYIHIIDNPNIYRDSTLSNFRPSWPVRWGILFSVPDSDDARYAHIVSVADDERDPMQGDPPV